MPRKDCFELYGFCHWHCWDRGELPVLFAHLSPTRPWEWTWKATRICGPIQIFHTVFEISVFLCLKTSVPRQTCHQCCSSSLAKSQAEAYQGVWGKMLPAVWWALGTPASWLGAGARSPGLQWSSGVMLSIWLWLWALERLFLLLKKTFICNPPCDFFPMHVECWSLFS